MAALLRLSMEMHQQQDDFAGNLSLLCDAIYPLLSADRLSIWLVQGDEGEFKQIKRAISYPLPTYHRSKHTVIERYEIISQIMSVRGRGSRVAVSIGIVPAAEAIVWLLCSRSPKGGKLLFTDLRVMQLALGSALDLAAPGRFEDFYIVLELSIELTALAA